jgi:class 3 adenylate cyclase
VMFSDLVGSTALSARMDPEDLREVISAYQKSVAETVQRFGGFVAKYMGDGVLVYFGYPQAHEDDAERAVRAGLELVAAVGALKTHAPLQTRIGIATGLVVVGDLIGSGASQEQAIVGETPNLAARLQGIAEPNGVVIAESTRKLLGNLFELEDLGAQDLKGIAGPIRAWAALRDSSAEGRFDALHASGLTELVGRQEEFELPLRRWSKAKSGEGQVVLLSGEPGIGKSRLTAALLERLAAEPHTRLRYFCSPQRTDSAFYPIISQMERAAGLAHDDTTHAKLDKLDAVLAQTSTPTQNAALFAEMLSLPNDGRYPSLDLAPEERRQRTQEALTAQLAGLTRQRPALMIVEDAHWVDPTSLEVFGRTVDQIKTLPVLLIVTFRPEFNAPWAGRSHVTTLALNRLGERETAAIIARIVGNKDLPADVTAEIVERTDGIPLFVEEMTKAVLEAESESEARKTTAAMPSPALGVPASLHASLMARLDRLGPAKEVAQIGAAIGREFSHVLLSAVASKPEADLNSALNHLVSAGLAFRQGVPPHATYLFKHALVQDAAYGMLLREPRRALHARIAETLEGRFADVAETQPELLARHCTEAGLIEKAAGLWGKAGQRSLVDPTSLEVFGRTVDQIKTLPVLLIVTFRPEFNAPWAGRLVALADERGAPYGKALGTVVRGWLFAVTGKASDAVWAITSGITSLRSTGATLYKPRHLSFLAMAYAEIGQLDDAWRCIDDAIEKVERSKEKWGEAEVHRIAGEIALKSPAPDPEKAETYFEHALAVARQQQAKSWELRAAMSMARLWHSQGKPQQARELLAPVYGWFTEGFDTRDLKEAKALLEGLAT